MGLHTWECIFVVCRYSCVRAFDEGRSRRDAEPFLNKNKAFIITNTSGRNSVELQATCTCTLICVQCHKKQGLEVHRGMVEQTFSNCVAITLHYVTSKKKTRDARDERGAPFPSNAAQPLKLDTGSVHTQNLKKET